MTTKATEEQIRQLYSVLGLPRKAARRMTAAEAEKEIRLGEIMLTADVLFSSQPKPL